MGEGSSSAVSEPPAPAAGAVGPVRADSLFAEQVRNLYRLSLAAYAGTLLCASALAKLAASDASPAINRKRTISAAVKETAAYLGNTAAVCRASYIDPHVFKSYESGPTTKRLT